MRLVQATMAFLVWNHWVAERVEWPTDKFTRYIADYVFALPTVAFFMCAIGIFIIGNAVSQYLGLRNFRGPPIWQKLIASVRYLSYRGFHVKSLRWNSAPVGILLLGLAGTIFFFCKLESRVFSPTTSRTELIIRQVWIWFRSLITGQVKSTVTRHHWPPDLDGWAWHACRSYCKSTRRAVNSLQC